MDTSIHEGVEPASDEPQGSTPQGSTAVTPQQFGSRLRQRRLAKGWSLDDLAQQMGGIVTRQAIHKYEKGQAQPSPRALQALAKTLGVKAMRLIEPQQTKVTFVAYRKASGLGTRELECLEARTALQVEERTRLSRLLGQELDLPTPFHVDTLEDAEKAAESLRSQWQLGVDAICSLTTVLEDHGVHVMLVEAPEKFNGLSAHVEDASGAIVAAVVIVRNDLPGDRQRLTIAHELGHLVLKFAADVEDKWIERAVMRFAAALLAPRALVEREVGAQRHNIALAELFLLKPRLGMSAQAITYRLKDLNIFSAEDHKNLSILFARTGMRKDEPHKLEPERSTWLQQSTYRALAEGLISREEARELLGDALESEGLPADPLTLRGRREFLKLPVAERRRLLESQNEMAKAVFADETEWHEWERSTSVENAGLDTAPVDRERVSKAQEDNAALGEGGRV